MGAFDAVKISENVYWVGAVDWAVRDFHGYLTSRGTTYNAYLIMAEKITLVDTVKAPFYDEMMSRISSVVDPEKIDIIISNHSEMDHTGCLQETIRRVKPQAVYASPMGVKALCRHFGFEEDEITPVKDGSSISLGNMDLSFVWTRMLHWPDSMFSYLAEDGVLFSQDAFGMHLASNQRFDDEMELTVLDHEAAKYYANILTPFSSFVKTLLEKVGGMNLKLNLVAPDHGPIWRKHISRIIDHYGKWASPAPSNKAVVVFDTMWKATEKMAAAIGEGLGQKGADVRIMPMGSNHRSDVMTELLTGGALLAGSSTLNRNLFPTMADLLTYLRGLQPQNLMGAAFGSYGWSGEGPDQVRQYLEEIKVEIIADTLKVKYMPDSEELNLCRNLGLKTAEKLQERLMAKAR